MGSQFPFSPAEIQAGTGGTNYPDSFAIHEGAAFWLMGNGADKRLGIVALPDAPILQGFEGRRQGYKDGYILLECPADHANGAALRRALPWLKPTLLGLETSAGFGDRLGLATPGHTRALRHTLAGAPTRSIAPIFAQQSIREMERSQRTPQDVLSDATWGTFEAGWRGKVGADADHLKTTADIDACVAAGFTFFTIDPGAYVDGEADLARPSRIAEKLEELPWNELESSPADTGKRYGDWNLEIEAGQIQLSLDAVHVAAVKYGGAIAHVVRMYRHLLSQEIPFELEVSVDETDTPTSLVEHVYIASELKRLGVEWVSLAPRYVGRFEKGIDYIGDLATLADTLAGHAAIARRLGPYKLSLHSGSDKFSVYPLIVLATDGLVHLKTAGTSYLEALRVVAAVDPALFRRIGDLAHARYPEDRASYHVSADLSKVPVMGSLKDEQLATLLDDTDAVPGVPRHLRFSPGRVQAAVDGGPGSKRRGALCSPGPALPPAPGAVLLVV